MSDLTYRCAGCRTTGWVLIGDEVSLARPAALPSEPEALDGVVDVGDVVVHPPPLIQPNWPASAAATKPSMRMLPGPQTNPGRIDTVANPDPSPSRTICSAMAFTAQ